MRQIKFRTWDTHCDKMIYIDDFYFFEENGIHDSTECCLMQFTGLHDKNGKEIYEKDVIKDQFGECEVEWGTFGWFPFEYIGGGEISPQNCEVIGNIYETPNLLNK